MKTIYKGSDSNFVVGKNIVKSKVCNERKTQTIIFDDPPSVISRMAVVGEKEGKGPLSRYFQVVKGDDKNGEKTFEQAEIDMLEEALKCAADRLPGKLDDLDLILSGDLLNQITTSSYVCRNINTPYLCIYSACSTLSESIGKSEAKRS